MRVLKVSISAQRPPRAAQTSNSGTTIHIPVSSPGSSPTAENSPPERTEIKPCPLLVSARKSSRARATWSPRDPGRDASLPIMTQANSDGADRQAKSIWKMGSFCGWEFKFRRSLTAREALQALVLHTSLAYRAGWPLHPTV